MEYTMSELLFFLFCYSFLGWCMEVAYMAVRTGKFCNRGFFNLPLCLSYGAAMDLLLVVLPTLKDAYLMQLTGCMVITTVCAQMADEVSIRLTGKRLWENERHSVYSGKLMGFVYALLMSGIAAVVLVLIHPVLFFLCSMIPSLILKIAVSVVLILLIMDMITVLYTVKKRPFIGEVQNISVELSEQKKNLGSWLASRVWGRLMKAYPNLKPLDSRRADGETSEALAHGVQEQYVFAKGICLDKIIWVFFISSLLGDLIETFYVRLVGGVWMSRSSVLYGTFSIVWGAGAALLTLLLHRLADKEDRYIFLGGFFLGGTYEYMCSVFTEVFFGTTFWDYSGMRFNIGGRTNLLFCFFWGILSLVWVKICYPRISRWIEKIPPVTGKILTWVCVALMACDMLISAMAMVRYVERSEGIPAQNAVEEFVDEQYPDGFIEWTWPNLRIE